MGDRAPLFRGALSAARAPRRRADLAAALLPLRDGRDRPAGRRASVDRTGDFPARALPARKGRAAPVREDAVAARQRTEHPLFPLRHHLRAQLLPPRVRRVQRTGGARLLRGGAGRALRRARAGGERPARGIARGRIRRHAAHGGFFGKRCAGAGGFREAEGGLQRPPGLCDHPQAGAQLHPDVDGADHRGIYPAHL